MKRIDTVNARPDINGAGKAGFHDNSDISGKMRHILILHGVTMFRKKSAIYWKRMELH